tara:strand:- start:1405 stop:1743 length:339 start_codon:yes stop_codon:yes gene_type:complete
MGENPLNAGTCVASVSIGFEDDYGVSSDLEWRFALWTREYQYGYDEAGFSWARWNEWAMDLCHELAEELGLPFGVEYHFAIEYPTRKVGRDFVAIRKGGTDTQRRNLTEGWR